MSDNDSDTPLDFSQFDCDEYPEAVENSARKLPKEDSPFVWTPECLEIMKRYGCGPEETPSQKRRRLLMMKIKWVSWFAFCAPST